MEKSDSQLIRETAEKTSAIYTRLFGAAEGDEGFIKSTTHRLNDHTNRLKKLEHWRWFMAGAGAVLLFELTSLLAMFHK